MAEEAPPQALNQTGHVKSWNGAKGYGFINSDAISGDIMFSKRELPEDVREVQGSFLQGRPVAFEMSSSPDGRMKASFVQLLTMEGKPLPGIVKSWSDKNGYGFITSSSLQEDVRFSRTDMPQVPLGVQLQGQLVTFHLKSRPDGKLMAQGVQFQSGQTAQRLQASSQPLYPQPLYPQQVLMQPRIQPAQLIQPIYPSPYPSPRKGAGKGQTVGFTNDASQASGTVKSYSERNRYGFINVPGQQGDIKFGQADLVDPSFLPQVGTQVSFSVLVDPSGRVQAKGVRPGGGGGAKRAAAHPAPVFHGPEPKRLRPTAADVFIAGGKGGGKGGGGGVWSPAGAGGSVPTGQVIQGTVKSFNVAKGFGFITSSEAPTDVYFGVAVLSPEVQSYAGELVGMGVQCQLTVAPDGKIRAQNIQMV